ncbi:coenzyme F420-0:L-glutamate ligase [Candidatus Nomurabacteria bacterium]|nr:coenzyme F420-0:L-glutamate ligase [Candidatus Nomurabacteria bacterium]
MNIKVLKTKIFKEGEDLISFLFSCFKKIPENSIIVITSKVVSLSQKRIVAIDPKISYKEFRDNLIRDESDLAVRTASSWLTIKDGMAMSSAGVDESNANGKIILLPKNSFKTAEKIRQALKKKHKLKNIGVLITDSRRFPLRRGIFGVAVGYAGFKGIIDYRGAPDIFGRLLKFAEANAADSLASAAVLCMGEGSERKPLAIIQKAPVVFADTVNKKELIINWKEDLYLPLWRSILKK